MASKRWKGLAGGSIAFPAMGAAISSGSTVSELTKGTFSGKYRAALTQQDVMLRPAKGKMRNRRRSGRAATGSSIQAARTQPTKLSDENLARNSASIVPCVKDEKRGGNKNVGSEITGSEPTGVNV
jgi:hypothetical protein